MDPNFNTYSALEPDADLVGAIKGFIAPLLYQWSKRCFCAPGSAVAAWLFRTAWLCLSLKPASWTASPMAGQRGRRGLMRKSALLARLLVRPVCWRWEPAGEPPFCGARRDSAAYAGSSAPIEDSEVLALPSEPKGSSGKEITSQPVAFVAGGDCGQEFERCGRLFGGFC